MGPLLHNSPPLHIVPECWGGPWVQGVGATRVKLLFVQWTPNGPKLCSSIAISLSPRVATPMLVTSKDKLCHPIWWAWVLSKVRIHRIAIKYEPSLTYMYEVTPPKLGSGRSSWASEPIVTQIGDKKKGLFNMAPLTECHVGTCQKRLIDTISLIFRLSYGS